jgi:hypothetical protein
MGYEKVDALSFGFDFAIDVAFVRCTVGKDADVVALEMGGDYREARENH